MLCITGWDVIFVFGFWGSSSGILTSGFSSASSGSGSSTAASLVSNLVVCLSTSSHIHGYAGEKVGHLDWTGLVYVGFISGGVKWRALVVNFIWLNGILTPILVGCFIRTWLPLLLPYRPKATRSIPHTSFSYLLWLDQYLPPVCTGPSLEPSPSYVPASVPSPALSDRSSSMLRTEHAAKSRLNEVDYVALDNVDPSATEDKVHDLLLQVIHLTGYHHLSPLSTPELATPSSMQADTFPNSETDFFIPNTSIHLSLEQLPEVVVAEKLGQREVENEEDLIFEARECYQTLRRQRNCQVYWPRVDLQC